MKQVKLTALVLIHLVFCNYLRAQQPYALPQVTPKSPNVASMDKYGEIPVTLNTGRANISVDLYSFTVGSVTFPISLTYHNDGLKVDELPSWVGHGWDLQVGGAISYHQKGIKDFDPNFGMFYSSSLSDLQSYLAGTMTSTQRYDYLERIMNDQEDSQFDLYTYNFLGNSGSFFFDANQNIIPVPTSDLKISKTTNGFKIIDLKGNQFLFENLESSTMMPVTGIEVRPSFGGNSAYYLTKVTTATGREVLFNYTNYSMQYVRMNKHLTFIPDVSYPSCPNRGITLGASETLYNVNNLLLQSVTFDEGSIEFIHQTTARSDLKKIDVNSNIRALQKIVVKNKANEILREFNLGLSYFGSNDRLKLSNVEEKNNLASSRKWQFQYNGEFQGFPAFFSNSKDHWGYYNGTYANTGIPSANYVLFMPNWIVYDPGYADKNAYHQSSKIGTLSKIIYPTGGYTQIEYEPNKLSISSMQDITPLSPYFLAPANAFTNTLVQLNNYTATPVTTSFTITQPTLVFVSGYTQFAEAGFYSSTINITGPQPSANELMQACQQSCSSSMCIGERQLVLQPGTYNVELIGAEYYDMWYNYAFVNAYLYIAAENVTSYEIGGSRISRITLNDETQVNPNQVKRFIYNDAINEVVFRAIPFYHTYSNYNEWVSTYFLACGQQFSINDESVRPMVGSVVEYLKVTELYDQNGTNGKIDYVFKPSETFGGGSLPYVEPTITSWRAGLPLNQKTFKNQNNVNVLIDEKTNLYYNSARLSLTNGIKVDYGDYSNASNPMVRIHRTNLATQFTEQFYRTDAVSVEVTNANLTTSNKSYFHSTSHNLPTTNELQDSKGNLVKQKKVYSFDYGVQTVTSPEAHGIKNLKTKNILVPIETINIKNIGGSDYVIAATITTYKSSLAVPDKVYSLKLAAPLLLSNFTQSHIDLSGNFIKDSRYEERINVISYDNFQNTLEQQNTNDVLESYIYDYQKTYPIAKCTNGSQSEIAYTSFEADGTGNWAGINTAFVQIGNSITGKKHYNQPGFSLSKSGLSTGPYIVSYWSNNGSYNVNGTAASALKTINTWNYYEHVITSPAGGVVTVTGSGPIDELRLYPKKAQMSTFAYEPLVGVTAQCDEKSLLTYYEYDGFARLFLVRNYEGKILKKYCYNYNGQPEDCSTGCPTTAPDWQYVSATCELDGLGQYTGNEIITERDMNTCSQSYYQTRTVSVYNPGTCPPPPPPCYNDCTAWGEGWACINGECEYGVIVYTESRWEGNVWFCTYHYEYSNGSWGQEYYIMSGSPCY